MCKYTCKTFLEGIGINIFFKKGVEYIQLLCMILKRQWEEAHVEVFYVSNVIKKAWKQVLK